MNFKSSGLKVFRLQVKEPEIPRPAACSETKFPDSCLTPWIPAFAEMTMTTRSSFRTSEHRRARSEIQEPEAWIPAPRLREGRLCAGMTDREKPTVSAWAAQNDTTRW